MKTLRDNGLYRFGNFEFDPDELVLTRDGASVSLTPKMFEVLKILVDRRGRIVPKDHLMKAVWPDSFVEEGNLAVTIRHLRKALEDDAHHPEYIETVPRRGYRFIAELKETRDDHIRQNGENNPVSTATAVSGRGRRRYLFPVFISAIVMTAVAGFLIGNRRSAATAPVLSRPFASEKLSTNGKVFSAAISPDGKMVVYTNRNGGKQSVWLRNLESSDNVEIIPPSNDDYYTFAFSPDGNVLYFSRKAKSDALPTGIYSVSLFGGVPQKVVSAAQGRFSLSPDGSKISFVRCNYLDGEFCSLWIADADGENEQKLLSRPRPIRIGDNEISPDGKTIAFAAGQSENAANEFTLSEIDIESGAERELSSERFFNISHIAWLPDRGGVLITASRIPNRRSRIWLVSANFGTVERLTKDSESYSVLGLDTNANAIVSTQVKEDFRLRLFQMDEPSAGRELVEGTTLNFAADGRFVFSSATTGNDEIWSMEADGSDRRQLTNHTADDFAPVVSANKDSVFFASNRSGEAHVWRMNSDGSDQIQITHRQGGFPIFASPDNKWLYYHHGLQRTLWRISLESGDEQIVYEKPKYFFAFSPDGSQFAYTEKQGDQRLVTIASLTDGRTLRTFPYPDATARMLDFEWLPDGSGVAFILSNSEYIQNALWLQPLNDENARKVADLGDDEITSFAFAPDGKSFTIAQGSWRHDAVLISGLK